MSDQINWGYNCLTLGIYHGRPEIIWSLPLLQATSMFTAGELSEFVVTRIYNDAMQFVERGEDKSLIKVTPEWAKKVSSVAEDKFFYILDGKLREIKEYYESFSWHDDVRNVIAFVKEDKLNPRYQPLHSHDSVNILCRIVGQSSVIAVNKG